MYTATNENARNMSNQCCNFNSTNEKETTK